MWTVTIQEVGSRGTTYTTRVRTEMRDEALARAMKKLWGAGCIWQPDSGVPGMGQVFQAACYQGDPSFSSRTRRARLTIEED